MKPGPVVFSPLIRWCEIDGIVFVLDLKSDIYSALDPSLSTDWLVASRTGDVRQSVRQVLAERGWRPSDTVLPARGDHPMPVVTTRMPVFRAATCLTRARKNLRAGGLAQAVHWAERHEPVSPRISLERAQRAFRLVEGLLPNRQGDLDCLPRSLALFAMLRGYGLDVCHKIGLHRYPFDAHAWVECNGAPILEREAPRDDDAATAHHSPRTIIMKSA